MTGRVDKKHVVEVVADGADEMGENNNDGIDGAIPVTYGADEMDENNDGGIDGAISVTDGADEMAENNDDGEV